MTDNEIIQWLLDGDVSIQYQAHRDLLFAERKDLQQKIAFEGWGKQFLSEQKPDGHWGDRFYQPKWTSSHYTLLDLRNLNISPDTPPIRKSINRIASEEKSEDGGVNPAETIEHSDVCVNGMFLNYASYFRTDESKLQSVVDFILSQIMEDGGFNCRSNRSGAIHSSLHTTLSVLEGIEEYQINGYTYRLEELETARKTSIEFILQHRLFLSDKTGEIIHKDFLRFTYPCRWRYDVFRALDYFQYADVAWDERMLPAIKVLQDKRNIDGTWNVQAKHPGKVHFEMEQTGKPSRWNTLRALRILKHYT